MPGKYEYQSDYARHWVAVGRTEGRVEGKAEGRAEALNTLLELRFGPLSEQERAQLRNVPEVTLGRLYYRLLEASSVEEFLADKT